MIPRFAGVVCVRSLAVVPSSAVLLELAAKVAASLPPIPHSNGSSGLAVVPRPCSGAGAFSGIHSENALALGLQGPPPHQVPQEGLRIRRALPAAVPQTSRREEEGSEESHQGEMKALGRWRFSPCDFLDAFLSTWGAET